MGGLYGRKRKCFDVSDFNFGLFRFDLDSYEEYLNITNELIEQQIKAKIKEYESYGDVAGFIFDFDKHVVRHRILRLYYSSIIISLYSFLEQSMHRLCEITETNQLIKIGDISGKGIFKFKTYLEKVVSIDFNEINSEWNEITKYNHLRNLFVHSSNTVIDETNSVKRKNSIKEISGLKLIDSNNRSLIEFENDDSIRNFIRIIRQFLKKIYYSDF